MNLCQRPVHHALRHETGLGGVLPTCHDASSVNACRSSGQIPAHVAAGYPSCLMTVCVGSSTFTGRTVTGVLQSGVGVPIKVWLR